MSDLAMCVGAEKFYPWPDDFIEEAKKQGVSKAISKSAVPYIEPGITRVVFIHPRAIVHVTAEGLSTLDFAHELVREYIVEKREPPPENKAEMIQRWGMHDIDDWPVAYALDKLIDVDGHNKLHMCTLLREADRAKDLERLEEKYGLKYQHGYIGYTYPTGLEYEAKPGETELPDRLLGIPGIEMVHSVYKEEDK